MHKFFIKENSKFKKLYRKYVYQKRGQVFQKPKIPKTQILRNYLPLNFRLPYVFKTLEKGKKVYIYWRETKVVDFRPENIFGDKFDLSR